MIDKCGKLNRKYYFQCCNNFDASKAEVSCPVRITEDKLDEIVHEVIKKQVKMFTDKKEIISVAENALKQDMKQFNEKIKALKSQIEKEEYAVSRKYEEYVTGEISSKEFTKVQARAKQQIDSLNDKIVDMENDRIKRKMQLEEKLAIIKSLYRVNGKKSLDKSMLHILIQKIEIMPDSELKIVFHFENPLNDVVDGESAT